MAEWFTVGGATPEEETKAQERLVAAWVDAPIDNLEVCGMLLEVAREQVLAYAPDPEDSDDLIATAVAAVQVIYDTYTTTPGTFEELLADIGLALDPVPATVPPTRYVYAQLQQAGNLWNAGRVTSAGETGMDGFVFTPRPLDKTIRQIIRPTHGVPNV